MAPPSTLPHIPGDIMKSVFHILPLKDRANVMRVNREWRSAASHEDLWHDMTITVSQHVPLLPSYAKNITFSGPGVACFITMLSDPLAYPLPDVRRLKTCRSIGANALSLLTTIPSLRSLDISFVEMPALSSEALKAEVLAVAALTKLTQLVLTGKPVGRGALSPVSCLINLEDLDVCSCNLIDDDMRFIACLTALKQLNISCNRRVTNDGIEGLTLLTALQGLKAADCHLSCESGPTMAKLTNLRHLDLSWAYLEIEGIRCVGELTLLTALWLQNELTLEAQYFTDLITGWTTLTRLKVLYLGNPRFSAATMQLLGGFLELEELHLPGGKLSVGAGHAISQLTNLRELDISQSDMQGIGLMHLNTLSKLRVLRAFKIALTSTALDLSNLTALQYLDLSDNHVGPAGAAALSPLTNLRRLFLQNAHIRGVGVERLSTLKKLQTLDLSWNNIGSHAVAHLSTLVSLSSLHLSNCNLGVMQDTPCELHLSALSTLTNLEYLDVAGNFMPLAVVPQLAYLMSLRCLKMTWNIVGESDNSTMEQNDVGGGDISMGQNNMDGSDSMLGQNDMGGSDNTLGQDNMGGNVIAMGHSNFGRNDTATGHINNNVGGNDTTTLQFNTMSGNNITTGHNNGGGNRATTGQHNMGVNDVSTAQNNVDNCAPTKQILGGIRDSSMVPLPDGDLRALSSLTRLTHLDLSSNKLPHTAGSQLASLTSLVTLDVTNNALTTAALSVMTTLTRMTCLRIGSNALDRGSVPLLARFQHLKVVWMKGNISESREVVFNEVKAMCGTLTVHV